MLHPLLNNTVFWDLHCMYKIEKWRKETAAQVKDWFDVIGEFEALSGFACLKFNNPDWVMPEVSADDGSFRLEAIALGHPLIPREERVCNDILFGGAGMGSMAIITGPNMAGKSTFLRTVGVNIITALAGAPVCAAGFKISPVKLFTSMQTSDSLDKHLSLFYAELQRLKMVIDGIMGKEPVFFLIDEMLKGTNALDRQKGAIALLKQLMRSRANGVTATHDLQLTKLDNPDEWEKAGDVFPHGIQVANYHFDGYIEDDRLLFDYKLKQGICDSFNALVLMKKMGIDL
jgi:DNA mismatch repair ATPase MutS